MTPDPRDVLTQIAGIGYGAVEPYDVLSDPVGFRGLLDELGLAVSSAHAPVLSDKLAAVLDAAAILGTTTLIVPSTDPARWTDRESVAGVATEVNEAAKQAAERGVRIAYHNHWFELENVIDGRYALEVFADELDPGVILEVDTYWATVGGADAPALLERLGERVRYLHIKDGPAVKGEPMTAVGQGTLPVDAILTANPAVEWLVVELDECATDMITALTESHAYLFAKSPK